MLLPTSSCHSEAASGRPKNLVVPCPQRQAASASSSSCARAAPATDVGNAYREASHGGRRGILTQAGEAG